MRRTIFAAAFAAALLIWPETAILAAREAMGTWYLSVAPALFPFMLLMPMLTGPEAAAAYERLLGRFMRPLFGLPGAAAPAIVIGMTAGSPAGAIAAVRTADAAGLDRDALERIVGCVCGLSPAFLISGIGASMLGSAADGRILLRSQMIAQLLMLLLSKRRHIVLRPPKAAETVDSDSVRSAVMAVLGVCGYMMIFQVAAALLGKLLGRPWAELAAICALDVPSGARTLADMPMDRETRLVLLSALVGMAGLCIWTQNLSACRKKGVRMGKFAAARLACAALMSGATVVQLHFPLKGGASAPSPLEISALIASVFAMPTCFFLARKSFFNKQKVAEIGNNNLRKTEIPQYVVENHGTKTLNTDSLKIEENA